MTEAEILIEELTAARDAAVGRIRGEQDVRKAERAVGLAQGLGIAIARIKAQLLVAGNVTVA